MENKKKDDFHKIKLSIEDLLIKELVVKEVCSECLDLKDVKVWCNQNGVITYSIKNRTKYNDKSLSVFVDNFKDHIYGRADDRIFITHRACPPFRNSHFKQKEINAHRKVYDSQRIKDSIKMTL